jgi:hypothetical protein
VFARNKLIFWVGIITLSGMFLMGQQAWPPQTECTVPEDCTDLGPCTDTECVGFICVYTDNTDPCDDWDHCTTVDACSGGVCIGGGDPPDADGDSYIDKTCGGEDCDDSLAGVYPGAPEICDGIDNQCPGYPGYDEIEEGCSSQDLVVFVTSHSYTGNLGGLEGADAICQTLASAAGLPGTFLPWLSSADLTYGENSPSTRFNRDAAWHLLTGERVAYSWVDLTERNYREGQHEYLRHTIDVDQSGNPLPPGTEVWTNTDRLGRGGAVNYDCEEQAGEGWNYGGASQELVYYGSASATTARWTAALDPGATPNCSQRRALYCFQQ